MHVFNTILRYLSLEWRCREIKLIHQRVERTRRWLIFKRLAMIRVNAKLFGKAKGASRRSRWNRSLWIRVSRCAWQNDWRLFHESSLCRRGRISLLTRVVLTMANDWTDQTNGWRTCFACRRQTWKLAGKGHWAKCQKKFIHECREYLQRRCAERAWENCSKSYARRCKSSMSCILFGFDNEVFNSFVVVPWLRWWNSAGAFGYFSNNCKTLGIGDSCKRISLHH